LSLRLHNKSGLEEESAWFHVDIGLTDLQIADEGADGS
jgi:hypothetical protein